MSLSWLYLESWMTLNFLLSCIQAAGRQQQMARCWTRRAISGSWWVQYRARSIAYRRTCVKQYRWSPCLRFGSRRSSLLGELSWVGSWSRTQKWPKLHLVSWRVRSTSWAGSRPSWSAGSNDDGSAQGSYWKLSLRSCQRSSYSATWWTSPSSSGVSVLSPCLEEEWLRRRGTCTWLFCQGWCSATLMSCFLFDRLTSWAHCHSTQDSWRIRWSTAQSGWLLPCDCGRTLAFSPQTRFLSSTSGRT